MMKNTKPQQKQHIKKTAQRKIATKKIAKKTKTLTTPHKSIATKSAAPFTTTIPVSAQPLVTKSNIAFKSFNLTLTTTPQRAFRTSQPLFNEPAPTGPAAVDDLSPKVKQIVSDILALNIMESLQLTKALKKEFGYNDAAFAMAAPVAVAGGGGAAAAAPAEEEKPKAAAKTIFNVKLESYDAASKVKIIKEVRAITGLGLKEAKELVDGAPQILKKEVKKEDAEAMIKLMKDTGAVCIME